MIIKGQSPLFSLQETRLKRLFRYEPLGSVRGLYESDESVSRQPLLKR